MSTDCLLSPELIQAAGPFMGTALMMLAVMAGAVWKVKDKTTRLRLLGGAFAIQAIALLGGMAYAFIHGI